MWKKPLWSTEFSHRGDAKLTTFISPWVNSEEVTGKQFPGLSVAVSQPAPSFPPNEFALLCTGGGQCGLAMVQWSPPHSSPGHMGSYAVASTDLGMGEEIALQPFNKSCPSLEYINFSLYRRCRVTCHENPLKTFSLLWETNWKCILCCVSDQGTAKNV